MEKPAAAAEADRLLLLQVELAREKATNQAISLALDSDGYMELAELYDQLSIAVCEWEAELHLGHVAKPTLDK